eukprot:SAG11_NODE_2884_length_2870_cov_1.601949_4_plen_77_part_00
MPSRPTLAGAIIWARLAFAHQRRHRRGAVPTHACGVVLERSVVKAVRSTCGGALLDEVCGGGNVSVALIINLITQN